MGKAITIQTPWTNIEKGRQGTQEQRQACIHALLKMYYEPICNFIAAKYNVPDPKDIAHDFILNFMTKNLIDRPMREKGKFRNLLMKMLDNYISDYKKRQKKHTELQEWKAAAPNKRPEKDFAKATAQINFDEICEVFHIECANRHMFHYWNVLDRHDLTREQRYPGITKGVNAHIAQDLNFTPKQVADYLTRARALFARVAREYVREYLKATTGKEPTKTAIEDTLDELIRLATKGTR